MSRIVIVDEHDNPIGLKERSEVGAGDIWRGSGVWITNSRGDVLLAQRAFSKEYEPGKWSTAVAGAVDEGEDYRTNAVKEAQEELGLVIDDQKLVEGPKRFVDYHDRRYFFQWYFYTINIPKEKLILQKEEVNDVRWISRDELQKELLERSDTFFRNSAEWIQELLRIAP